MQTQQTIAAVKDILQSNPRGITVEEISASFHCIVTEALKWHLFA